MKSNSRSERDGRSIGWTLQLANCDPPSMQLLLRDCEQITRPVIQSWFRDSDENIRIRKQISKQIQADRRDHANKQHGESRASGRGKMQSLVWGFTRGRRTPRRWKHARRWSRLSWRSRGWARRTAPPRRTLWWRRCWWWRRRPPPPPPLPDKRRQRRREPGRRWRWPATSDSQWPSPFFFFFSCCGFNNGNSRRPPHLIEKKLPEEEAGE